jgi:iron complex outermembrane recepter protein
VPSPRSRRFTLSPVFLAVAVLTSAIAFADADDSDLEAVVVTGRRVSEAAASIGVDESRNTISITREALLSAPSGVSGLKVLEQLPGFNVQANDALGLYEFGNSVFVRAFNFQQIGFVLDGVPLGRSDQFGGSPIFRYVDNENLQRVTASQGSGDVSLPSYASLGPIVQYFSADPAAQFGATVAQTFGSDSLNRSFIRVETGALGPFSAYVSRSKIDSDLWRGPGTIDREHLEGKARLEIGERSEISLKAVYNDFHDFDTPSITTAQYHGAAGDPFARSGRDFAYLDYVPALPETTAGVRFSNAGYNQYYLQAINDRTDTLVSLSGSTRFGDTVTLRAGLYDEEKDGYGVSPEAYSTSLASYNAERLIVPGLIAPRGLQYGLSTVGGDRKGATVGLEWERGSNSVRVGAWVESDDYHRTQARYNQTGGDPAGQPLLNEPVHLQRDYLSTRDTTQFFATWRGSLLEERLVVELGARALDIDYEISGYRNPADYIAQREPGLTDNWSDSFLPQAGAVFSLGAREQLFASYAENLALPRGADDIYSAASPTAPGPEAETSKNFEVGIRSNRSTFNGALALYYTTFDNRLQSFAAVVPGSTTTETFFQNVGGVTAYGAEVSGIWKPHAFRERVYFNTNVSYNVARFDDSYSTLNIRDNDVPDGSPWLAQAGVTTEITSWAVANLSARYLGPRYTNFVNSERIGGYTVLNAYVDLGGDEIGSGVFKALKLRFNVDNITNRDYLGTINVGTTAPASFRPGPDRTYQLTATLSL